MLRGLNWIIRSPRFVGAPLLLLQRTTVACLSKKASAANKSVTKDSESAPAASSSKASQALEQALKQIQSQYGKGAIMQLGQKAPVDASTEVISTGSIALDCALGIGGLPKGRVVEIFGPEASGKTTLALHVVAEAQKKGGKVVYIDAEHALNSTYAEKLGVNLNDLYLSQPDSGEQALEIADTIIRSNSAAVVVIDSVAALVPKSEIEGEMGDAHMALQARLMSQALRKLTPSIHKSNTLMIFINQIRHKVGVMFGSPEVTAGGQALKFYASVRLDIRRVSSIKSGDQVIGNRVKVKVAKNKMSAPFQSVEFDIEFGHGISRLSELVDLGISTGVLVRSGAWIQYQGNQIAHGKAECKEYLQKNPKVAQEVDHAIREALLKHTGPLTEETSTPDAAVVEDESSPHSSV